MGLLNYKEILLREYKKRKQRNPRYTLNSFARDLQISNSRLSQILKGKLGLSEKAAVLLSEALKLSESESKVFCLTAKLSSSRRSIDKEKAKRKLTEIKSKMKFKEVDLRRFSLVSDWYYYALLEALNVKSVKSDYSNLEEISKFCNLDSGLVRKTYDELLTEGFIQSVNGLLKEKNSYTATPSDIPSDSIKEYQSQIIKRAERSILAQDLTKRDISSIVISINKRDIERLKDKIKKFRRNIAKEFGSGNDKDAVYCLAIQLFDIF